MSEDIKVTVQDLNDGFGQRKFYITAEVAASVMNNTRMAAGMLERAAEAISAKLEEVWWERHGAELLESLAPGAIAEVMKEKLKAEIAKKILG